MIKLRNRNTVSSWNNLKISYSKDSLHINSNDKVAQRESKNFNKYSMTVPLGWWTKIATLL